MKRRIFWSLFMLLCAGAVFAQSSREFAVRANLINGVSGVTITGYFGTEKNVAIPATIDGFPVTSIGDQAFMLKGLTHVSLPDTVWVIGRQAFYGNQIKNVHIPSSVKTIGDSAFDGNQFINVQQGGKRVIIEIPAPASSQKVSSRNTVVNEIIIPPPPQTKGRITVIEKQRVQFPWQAKEYHHDVLPIQITQIPPPERIEPQAAPLPQAAIPAPQLQTPPPPAPVHLPPQAEYTISNPNAIYIETPQQDVSGFSQGVIIEESHTRDIIPASQVQDMGSMYPPRAIELAEPEAPPDEGIFYLRNNKNGTATIVGYRGPYNYVSIPRSIEGLTPVKIEKNAFMNHRLHKAYIADSIIIIADAAFAGNSILDITLPASVRHVGFQAFAGNDIKRVTIGDAVNIQPDSIHNGFAEFYNLNGKQAGTYIWREGVWAFTNFNDVRYYREDDYALQY
ncbi:MAG: leucine-rich repeat domain-containing protein [Spirochaetaceae bacterium]|jgi:hypothetical protein|nr:leucine-rich repeat domain-containing protein [Spirochaetaceae bacterium]